MKTIIYLILPLSLISCIDFFEENKQNIHPKTYPDTCNGEYFKKIIDIPSHFIHWQPYENDGLILISHGIFYHLDSNMEVINEKKLIAGIISCTQNKDNNLWLLSILDHKIHLIDTLGNELLTKDVHFNSQLIQSTNDNGLIISYSGWYRKNSVQILTGFYHLDKLDSNGSIEWRDSTNLKGRIVCTIQTRDENFLVGGFQYINGQNETNGTLAYLALHDKNGKLIWNKTYPNRTDHFHYEIASLLQNDDSSFIAIYRDQEFKVLPSKINRQGEILWQFELGNIRTNFNNCIYQQDHYLISTTQFVNYKKEIDIFLTCFNADGSILYTRQYGGTGSEFSGYVLSLQNKDLILLAETRNFDGTSPEPSIDTYILKSNSSGEITCN